MTKASDRRAFIKRREAFEKDVLKNLKVVIKGSGWRKSGNDLIRSVDGLFLNADMRSHLDAHKSEFWFRAKPMAIDEIFWDVMQIPENRDQPLSFRASAVFQCRIPYSNTLIVDDESQDSLHLAQTLLLYANEHAAKFQQTYVLADYIHQLEIHEEQIATGNYSTTLFCLYCVAGETDKARLFAEDHVSGKRDCGSTFGTIDQDFFELALEHLGATKPASKWKLWR